MLASSLRRVLKPHARLPRGYKNYAMVFSSFTAPASSGPEYTPISPLQKEFPMYIANEAVSPNQKLAIKNKYCGTTFATVPLANADHIEQAISSCHDAREACAKMPSWQKKKILKIVIDEMNNRYDEFAYALSLEAG